MENVDVLVIRPPQALEEPASQRIPTDWLLPTTLLEKNSISARFFNVDFLRKVKPYQYPIFKEYLSFKQRWKSLFSEKHPKWKNAKKVFSKYQPKILLIIPHHIYNIHSSLFLAKLAKKWIPEIKVVICCHEPYLHNLLLSNSKVDVIVNYYEDIEPIIVKVCKNLLTGKKLNKIPNLTFKREKIVNTKKLLLRADLNSLPIPDRKLVIDRKYYPPSSFGHILGGRGCGNQCQFCKEASPLRLRDPKLIIEEIAQVYLEYKTRDFAFDMSSFTRSKKWAYEVCNLIRKFKLNILWSCYANANEIDEEIIRAMKESGCWKIGVGFESGSDRILKLMRKPLNLQQSLKAAELIKKYGIFLYGGFIIGYPGEKWDDIVDTLKFIRTIKPDMFILQIFVPHPSVRIYRKIKSKIKDEKYWEYSVSQVKLKTETERRLKELWGLYFPLTNLCEKIIFRKTFLHLKFSFLKLLEIFFYLMRAYGS